MGVESDGVRQRLSEFTNILNSITDCFVSLDRSWHVIYINKAAARALHLDRRKLVDAYVWNIFPCGEELQKQLQIAMSRRRPVHFETYSEFLHRWVEMNAYPSTTGVSLLFRDISERKRNEEEICRRKQEFQTLVEHSQDIIVRVDRDLRCLYISPQSEAYTGLPSAKLIGRTVNELTDGRPFYQQWKEWVDLAFTSGKPSLHEANTPDISGEIRSFQFSLIPEFNENAETVTILLIARDVTELRRAELHAAQQERLELLGRMAVNISHEIRNPLTTVRGYLQYFAGKPAFHNYLPQLALLLDEIDRADQIIKTYLTLAANKRSILQRQDLKSLVEEMRPLLEAEARMQNCRLVIAMAELPQILMDEQEIRDLLLRLVRNGLEAMKSGCLTISSRCEAEKVILEIHDEGTGISGSVLRRLGTPFVTTKEDGLGLGLPVCFSIVNRHNGEIGISSGQSGTTVRICFPVQKTEKTEKERR